MAGDKQAKDGQRPEPDTLKITEQSEGIPGVNVQIPATPAPAAPQEQPKP